MGQQQEASDERMPARVRPAPDCVAQLDREPLLRALFDHAPLAQFIGTPDGTIERVNPAFTSLLGYSADEVCGKSVMAITHPDDVAKSWSSRRRVGLSLPRLSFQKRYLHKNGRVVSALVTLSAVEIDGRRCMIAQVVDLTAIKQAHAEVQRAHERLHTAMEGAGAGTWEIDLATGHMDWDEGMRRQFGLADDEPAPSLDAFMASIHEDDRRSVMAALHNAKLPGHDRFEHEYRIHCADGTARWYRGVGRVRRDETGRAVNGIGIALDITRSKQAQFERERMQAALHRAERRLAAIVANSRDAIISASPDLDVTTWNAAAEAMFGHAEAEAIGMPVMQLLAPERHHYIGKRLASLRAGQALPAVESRCLRRDGTPFDAEISLSPVPGDDGGPAWYSAIVRDITERKAAERHLQESRRRFDEIAETITEVFWTADPQIQRTLYISPGYERLWGRSCSSLLEDPRSFLEGIHPDDRAAVVATLAARQSSGQDFSHEYRVLRPDGSIRRVWDRGFAKRDPGSGEVTHYVGVAIDVTDRPRQEPGGAAAR